MFFIDFKGKLKVNKNKNEFDYFLFIKNIYFLTCKRDI